MKLPQLKKHFKNKYAIRIIAGVLTVAVIGTSVGSYTNVYAAKSAKAADTQTASEEKDSGEDAKEEDLSSMLSKNNVAVSEKKIDKDETVYVIADSTGNATKTIVSEWLRNTEKKDEISDASDLTDIENVKGEETFEQKGTELLWKANGNEIYYQGTTTKEIPVTTKISYYLDGKEISADEIAGKSGKVTVRFDYTNNEKTTAVIGGKNEDIYVPFVVVSGMILSDDFTNVKVTNGKVISNGSNNVVMGAAMPGLKDSLNVKDGDMSEDINIPEYVEMTADVENFSLDMTMTIATSSADLSLEGNLDFSDMDEKMDDLQDASAEIQDGSGTLAESMGTLKESMGTFASGVDTLKTGIGSYTEGTKQIADGIATLNTSSNDLIAGVGTLDGSASSLAKGVQTLDTALNTKMTDKEKANAAGSAKEAAEKAVDAQFADDKNEQSYNNLKNYAAQTFYDSLASDANKTAAAQTAKETVTEQLKTQIDPAAIGQQAADQITNESVQTALTADPAAAQMLDTLKTTMYAGFYAQYMSAQSSPAAEREVLEETDEKKDQTGVKSKSTADVQAAANEYATQKTGEAMQALTEKILQTSKTVASQSASTTAAQISAAIPDIAGTVASSTVESVAGQAKEQVGTSVATAAKTAAKTAAGSAAGEAVVAGAETAKSQIAAQIEAKDKSTGYSLVTGMKALSEGASKLNKSMPTLSTGITKLYNGSQTLIANNDNLNAGVTTLAEGVGKITEGVDKLDDGANELADGIVQFNEEGIDKLVNAYNGDIKDLVERIQAVMDAGSEYESFGGKSENAVGAVKFIIKTDAVKVKED